MEITLGKIVALIAALLLAIVSWLRFGPFHSMLIPLELLCPLALICFPDEIGRITGGYITRETPGIFVSVMGWIFLVAAGIVTIIGKPK
jgi:hypothetical protein